MGVIVQEVNVPAVGAVLASVLSGPARVTVYSDAGLTTPVTLPATLQQGGELTVYVPAVECVATVTAASGGAVLCVAGLKGVTTTTLTFRAGGEGDTLEAFGIDGGTP